MPSHLIGPFKGNAIDNVTVGADDQIPFMVQMCLDYFEKNKIALFLLTDKMQKIFDKVQAPK